MAAGLLLTVSLTLLGWGVEVQGGTQAKVCYTGMCDCCFKIV